MQIDWQIFIKPYIPIDEYVSDKTSSRKLWIFLFFVGLGLLTSLSLITRVEGKPDAYTSPNPINLKIRKLQDEIDNLEKENTDLELSILLTNNYLTKKIENREK